MADSSKIIDTDGTAGVDCDYEDAATWEAWAQGQGDPGNTNTALCRSSSGTADGELAIAGWKAGVAFAVKADTGHESGGIIGAGYTMTSTSTTGTLRIAVNTGAVEDIEIVNGASDTATAAVSLQTGFTFASGAAVTLRRCLLRHINTTSSAGYTVAGSYANLNLRLENCFVISRNRRGIDTRNSASAALDNCTFWSTGDQLGIVSDSELTCRNTYAGKASGSSEDFWTGGAAPTGSHNVSSDNSAATDYTSTATGKAGSTSFVSVTAGSENLHLTGTSFSLWGLAGTDLSGTFTTDIDGDTRSAWDIGADEYVAAGGATHDLTATAPGATTTSAPIVSVARALTATADAAVTTGATSASIARALTATATVETVTSTPTATVAGQHDLTATAAATTATSEPQATVARMLTAGAGVATTSSTPAATVARSLTATAAGATATSEPTATTGIFHELTASATTATTTATPTATVARTLTTRAGVICTTGTPAAAVSRALAVRAAAATETSAAIARAAALASYSNPTLKSATVAYTLHSDTPLLTLESSTAVRTLTSATSARTLSH